MSRFNDHPTPPPISADESRLRQLDKLISESLEAQQREAERRAEEEARQAAYEAARPGYTVADLERMRAELAAQIAERETHLRTSAERELLLRRAGRLREDIAEQQAKLTITETELRAVETRLA
jgi:hypothetical protein